MKSVDRHETGEKVWRLTGGSYRIPGYPIIRWRPPDMSHTVENKGRFLARVRRIRGQVGAGARGEAECGDPRRACRGPWASWPRWWKVTSAARRILGAGPPGRRRPHRPRPTYLAGRVEQTGKTRNTRIGREILRILLSAPRRRLAPALAALPAIRRRGDRRHAVGVAVLKEAASAAGLTMNSPCSSRSGGACHRRKRHRSSCCSSSSPRSSST